MNIFERRTWAAAALLGLAATAGAEEPPQKDAPPVVTASGKDGFTIQSEDGSYKLRITGYAQADGRFYLGDDDEDGVNTFLLRRVRPTVSGTVGRYFDFTIMPDFGGGSPQLQDAFLDARFHPAFRVKAGKFKTPVGLERLHSGSALTFVERGLPSALAPNRDVGIQVHGELAEGAVAYQAGLFDGVPDGTSDDADENDGKDVAGRLFLQPFKKGTGALQGLGFGVAGTTGPQAGALPSYRSTGQLTFFGYASGVSADGTRTRVAPQAQYQRGPFRLLGEWTRTRQRVRRADADARDLTHRAWQGVASFVLSGEAPSNGAVTPRTPFDPAQGGWGALEIAARVGALEIDGDAFTGGFADPARSARKATSWGVGLNWHLTRNVKYAATFDHTTYEGGAPAGGDRQTENALLLRAQVSF
jgi:phosphate-selective porin OprO and OprP